MLRVTRHSFVRVEITMLLIKNVKITLSSPTAAQVLGSCQRQFDEAVESDKKPGNGPLARRC